MNERDTFTSIFTSSGKYSAWLRVKPKKTYQVACCCCGVVHDLQFSGNDMMYRVRRNDRATAVRQKAAQALDAANAKFAELEELMVERDKQSFLDAARTLDLERQLDAANAEITKRGVEIKRLRDMMSEDGFHNPELAKLAGKPMDILEAINLPNQKFDPKGGKS